MVKCKTRVSIILLLISQLFIFSSCSYLEKRGALIGADKNTESNQVVPKKQFDELALKYAELLKKSKKDLPPKKSLMKEKEDLKNSLEMLSRETQLTETVDVFSDEIKKNELGRLSKVAPVVQVEPNYNSLSNEITALQKANRLLAKKQYDSALNILKELEQSSHRQVAVRAKFSIGELLLYQSEYDLALQVFEDIIKKDAFSGVILKALDRMILCTKKLGQIGKRDKYYSILHDFFESKT